MAGSCIRPAERCRWNFGNQNPGYSLLPRWKSKVKSITYRIYGFFGPKGYIHSYTFLHGAEKSVKNDVVGKQIAKGRLDELERGTAGIHKFEFTGERNPQAAEEQGYTQ